jgi:hypothetical protein
LSFPVVLTPWKNNHMHRIAALAALALALAADPPRLIAQSGGFIATVGNDTVHAVWRLDADMATHFST